MWVQHHTLNSSHVLPCSVEVPSPAVRQSGQGTEASSCCRKSPADNVQQLLGESSVTRRIIQGLSVCMCLRVGKNRYSIRVRCAVTHRVE